MQDTERFSKLLNSAKMSSVEQTMLSEESKDQKFKSVFHFLNEHRGWRPGKVHLFLAPTHNGKSTLTRSLIWDFAINTRFDQKCLVWLSEESSEDFRVEFANIGLPAELGNKIVIVSEQDEELSLNEKKRLFDYAIKSACPSIVFFDNVTTSEFYMDRKVEEQSNFGSYLKLTAKQQDIPMVIIAHTGGDTGLNKRFLEANDIRGGKSIVNLAEFLYILQMIKVFNDVTKKVDKFPTLRIEKHRSQNDVENLFFQLKYNPVTVSFMEDRPKPYDEFKKLFARKIDM